MARLVVVGQGAWGTNSRCAKHTIQEYPRSSSAFFSSYLLQFFFLALFFFIQLRFVLKKKKRIRHLPIKKCFSRWRSSSLHFGTIERTSPDSSRVPDLEQKIRCKYEARPSKRSLIKTTQALPFVKYCYQHYLIEKLIKKLLTVRCYLLLSSFPF